MGTLAITVNNNVSPATYTKASGDGTVSTGGQIDFTGQGAGAQTITFTLASGTFGNPPITITDVVTGQGDPATEFQIGAGGGSSLTIVDDDNDAAQYNYCLQTSLGPLDPRIINRT